MAWLDAENGLFHFVLAREDFYYTDSLCRFHLWQNLEWTLKEKGYHTVLRVTDKKGHWDVSEGREKILFSGDTSEEFQNFWENRCERLLCERENRTAFLIRSDVFSKLFSREMGEVCERLECRPEREGIVVITAPREEEPLQKLFQGSNGILRSDFFLYVQRQLDQKKEKETVFSILERQMGERWHVVPEIKREEIRNMLFRNKVLGKWNVDCKTLEELTDFLFFYLRSVDFREEVGKPLPENRKMPLAMIERALLREGMIQKLKPILEVQRERIEAEKRKWIFEEAQEAAAKRRSTQTYDVLRREGAIGTENEVELPLYHMMVVQYQDGRRNSFFYPGVYKIPEGDKVRQILLIRRKETGFCAEWTIKEIPMWRGDGSKGQCEISGSCRVRILSYGKGIARYLLQEESRQREWTFQELIEEEAFFGGRLRRMILAVLESGEKGDTPGEKAIERQLNREWIYENGMYFFEFFVKEMKVKIPGKEEER